MNTSDLPILPVLEHYGATRPASRAGWQKIRCPFHEDKRPSASLNVEEGAFFCHACNIGGNAARLIATVEGVSYREAFRRAKEITGGRDGGIRTVGSSGRFLPGVTRDQPRDGGFLSAWSGG